MSNVLNRNTLEYITSVNTPDFPESEWLINPDMSSVADVPQKYWSIVDNNVVPMNPTEQVTKDTSILAEKEAESTPCPNGYTDNCPYINSITTPSPGVENVKVN
jgi:hypothetical protein